MVVSSAEYLVFKEMCAKGVVRTNPGEAEWRHEWESLTLRMFLVTLRAWRLGGDKLWVGECEDSERQELAERTELRCTGR